MNVGDHGRVRHPVHHRATAVVHHQVVGHALDGLDHLGALAAGVRHQHQMGDLLHDAAVDLFNAGLAVDDHIVEVAGQKIDDLLEVGVDLAVAPGGLRPADGQEGEFLLLHHGVEDAVPGLAEQLDGLPRLAILHRGHDLLTDIIQGLPYLHPQGGGQTHGGVRVDG